MLSFSDANIDFRHLATANPDQKPARPTGFFNGVLNPRLLGARRARRALIARKPGKSDSEPESHSDPARFVFGLALASSVSFALVDMSI